MMGGIRERIRPWYLRRFFYPLHPERKPSYFDACWNFPEYVPLPDSRPCADLPLILFLPMNDWHARTQRTQQLARALSALGYTCVYLNPHLGREFPDGYRAGRAERMIVLGPNLFELHVHLPREPVFHHRCLMPDEVDAVAGAVTRALVRLDARKVVQMVAFPLWLEVARTVRDGFRAPVFYDCHDYLPGFQGIARSILDLEPALFRESDRVLCSAQSLVERARQIAAPETPCMLLRNAAADEFFEVRPADDGAVTIGYVGALDTWFDAGSVAFAARAHPEWRFELIGRVEDARIRGLESLPNVHFAGEVAFAGLPGRLAQFRVGVIPFLISPLIEATDPIKAYEYLAAGLPVVSAALPELQRFREVVSFYSGAADFMAKLEDAVAAPQEPAQKRRNAARAETWAFRAEELSRWIQSIR
jgi:glycosyltransferase involved in cell wall biosynthesis